MDVTHHVFDQLAQAIPHSILANELLRSQLIIEFLAFYKKCSSLQVFFNRRLPKFKKRRTTHSNCARNSDLSLPLELRGAGPQGECVVQ